MRAKCDTNAFIALSGPHPTYLITANDPRDNSKAAIAVAWATPLSVNPPLFGIVISPNKHSNAVIREAGVFTVNVLPLDALDELWWSGTHTGRQYENKITAAGLTEVPGKTDKNATSVKEAIASFECKLKNVVPIGNHTLFVGEVVSVDAYEDFFDVKKGVWNPDTARLIYHLASGAFLTNC
ncbi:MAG: flavin reductase family protein [Candidatus Thorarchaeota archaeon]